MKSRFVLVWLPAMLACGNPVGPGAERLHIGATGIHLTVGDTMTLAVTLAGRRAVYRIPQEGYLPWPNDAPIDWRSSSSNVVSVNQSGRITAMGVGEAIITVESRGLRDSGTVIVHAFGSLPTAQFATLTPGGAHSCAVDLRGRAFCWGGSWHGELGTSAARKYTSTLSPVALAIAQEFTHIEAGELHTCALNAQGRAYCWGDNLSGQLGDGTTSSRFAPVHAQEGRTFLSVAAAADRTCGLTTQRSIVCWGSGWTGEAQSPSGSPFASVATGTSHTCALDSEGLAFCWGFNGGGQLGSGTTNSSSTPVAVAGGLRFRLISTGLAHTCAITQQDAAYCWGLGLDGRLGNESTEQRNIPTPVSGGSSFSDISAGGEHSCGVTTIGTGYCWGKNLAGQLGTGLPNPMPQTPVMEELRELSPTQVQGGLTFSAIRAGVVHSCGLTTDSIAYCWGAGGSGALGHGRLDTYPGTTVAMEPTPVPVAPMQ